jgi:hypothetical protein
MIVPDLLPYAESVLLLNYPADGLGGGSHEVEAGEIVWIR